MSTLSDQNNRYEIYCLIYCWGYKYPHSLHRTPPGVYSARSCSLNFSKFAGQRVKLLRLRKYTAPFLSRTKSTIAVSNRKPITDLQNSAHFATSSR